ncbi:IclR family transcriptional regulator [Neisseria weaveri]|uniref:Acetate operon repressor n=1 Tax=Neisseria weaveri TaxID=28091 RepID=A0A448VP40_9NEIS|nr:IclR family transcriptional regulator [Neisseria weaveri]EGV38937.1 transcriptional regulator IclR [Neisseria weaveri LMG 5135]VEJ51472.1 Acetate operon repressor [Neisseria weaveri]
MDTSSGRGSSITRVLEIIEAVAAADRPPTPQDLIQDLDIPKPSLHRLLKLLESEQFIQTDLQGGIVPGIRSLRLSVNIWQSKHHQAERIAILGTLSAKIGETCGISVPNGNCMSYTDRVQTNWPLQVYLPSGTQVPLYCTAGGKLYLSSLPALKRKRLIEHMQPTRMTQNTLTDPTALEQAIKKIGKTDIGFDDEEFISGMVGCSVPVLDADGQFIAALYTHAPTIRKSLDDLLSFVPDMKAASEEISKLLFQEPKSA